MKKKIKLNRWQEWREDLYQNKMKIAFSIIFFIIALIINYTAGMYTNRVTGNPSSDLILDHFGPYDLNFFYIWLFILVILIFIFYPLFYNPQKLSSTLILLSLFVIIRAIFTTLTHLKVPADAIYPSFPGFLQNIHFNNDLFFSGHVGLPFLGFFVFKENRKIRYFMLASSLLLGVTVLAMHAHYSIDVFAAFFISFGIYKMSKRFH